MEPIPADLRRKMVDAVHEGASRSAVARRFGVSQTVVGKLVRLAGEFVRLAGEGALEPKPPSGGPERSLDEADCERLIAAVDACPDATLEKLTETCGFDVSISTVSRALDRRDRSRKRKVPRAAEQSEERSPKARHQFQKEMADIDATRLVFVDETGIATNRTRRYGRAPAGGPVYTDPPYRHDESLTVPGGMRQGDGDEIPTMVSQGGDDDGSNGRIHHRSTGRGVASGGSRGG